MPRRLDLVGEHPHTVSLNPTEGRFVAWSLVCFVRVRNPIPAGLHFNYLAMARVMERPKVGKMLYPNYQAYRRLRAVTQKAIYSCNARAGAYSRCP